MSFCVTAIVAAKNAVRPPIITIINRAIGANSNRGEQRIIRNTPAVTNVAACIKADTGVGPSIASGNQVCNPIWADLPIDPTNRQKQIASKHGTSQYRKEKETSVKKGAKTKTIEKSTLLKKKYIRSRLQMKLKSPTLFITIAFSADLFA